MTSSPMTIALDQRRADMIGALIWREMSWLVESAARAIDEREQMVTHPPQPAPGDLYDRDIPAEIADLDKTVNERAARYAELALIYAQIESPEHGDMHGRAERRYFDTEVADALRQVRQTRESAAERDALRAERAEVTRKRAAAIEAAARAVAQLEEIGDSMREYPPAGYASATIDADKIRALRTTLMMDQA